MDENEISPFQRASSRTIGERSFSNIVNTYIRYYATGSSHTARAKRLDLEHFLKFLANFRGYSTPNKLKLKDWDFSAVQRFIEDSLQNGQSPSTVARRLATIKHLGRTLAERMAGFVNPAREARPPRIAITQPKALSTSEVRTIRKKAIQRMSDKESFIRLRNRTLFNFLIDTGIRADEVRLLKLSQLDDKHQWIKNVRTKGKRYRNVYITSAISEEFEVYLQARERELKRFYTKLTAAQSKALPLFISSYNAVPGKPETFLMGAKSIWRAVHELSAQTSLHPHLLRHSYALDLLKSSNDIRLVAQALGHSDVRTTMRYTQRHDRDIAHALEKSRKKNKAAI